METRNHDRLEKFILENRDELGNYNPQGNHMEKFLRRLNAKIKHYINIVPYLIKVAAVTIIMFMISVAVWNNFIRKDRDAISLRDKISLEIYRLLD